MKKKTSAISSYEAALQELQQIVEQLEEDRISIDELSVKMQRAATLLSYCKEKLRQTETEMTKLFK